MRKNNSKTKNQRLGKLSHCQDVLLEENIDAVKALHGRELPVVFEDALSVGPKHPIKDNSLKPIFSILTNFWILIAECKDAKTFNFRIINLKLRKLKYRMIADNNNLVSVMQKNVV